MYYKKLSHEEKGLTAKSDEDLKKGQLKIVLK